MMQEMMNPGSGSNAGMGMMNKLMQTKMLEEMFGMKVSAEPVDTAAEMVGQDPNGSFGVVGVRLMPATIALPVPQLSLETNGRLSIRPRDLEAAAKFFQSITERFTTQYDEASEKAKELEGYELFAAMMGVDPTK